MRSANGASRVVRHGWPYREIAACAGEQRALITHRQLRELGVPKRTIVDAVNRCRLHPYLHRGVYSLVEAKALPPLAAEQAGVLACGPRALLSHLSALSLWDLADPYPGPVQLTVVGVDTGRRRAGLQVHRTRSMPGAETRRRHGLPIVAPARALLDVAPLLSGRRLELALDSALTRRITSATAIRETLARHPGRSGAPRLRALLNPVRPSSMTESPGQERLLAMIRRAGLPAPETEQWIGRYRADLLWRGQRLVVEFDGWAWHGTRARFEADRARDNWLHNHGWRVVRVTGRQLHEQPERVLVWIATELARASG
jgi:very-short-patch-repair endonuclease